MTRLLFFRPDRDLAMQYASSWLGVGAQEAVKRGYDVVDLIDDRATKENLEKLMQEEKFEVAILGGHGAPNIFTGYEQAIVMQGCVNDQIMMDTISHFLSCSVGQELLPSIIQKGGIATIGYQVDFQFMIDTNHPVESDPYAEPFKEVTLAIIRKILDGATLKEVWDAGIAKCNEWIAKLWNKQPTDYSEIIACLEHDRDGMIALGDKESYVVPPRQLATTGQVLGLGAIAAFLLTRKPF